MKLYTEQQIKTALYLSSNCPLATNCEVLNQLTPIELPSDEEIKSYSDRYSTMHEDVSNKLGKYLVSAIHIDGVNWIKEQILNQNK